MLDERLLLWVCPVLLNQFGKRFSIFFHPEGAQRQDEGDEYGTLSKQKEKGWRKGEIRSTRTCLSCIRLNFFLLSSLPLLV